MHEYGHVSSLYKYAGYSAPIGIGLYLFQPVLYANVSMAWALDKKKRIVINLSGIYFEMIFLCINSIILLFFNINPNPLIIIFVIRTIYNLNPFIRSDGYWFMSDFFKIPNFRQKSDIQLKNVFLKSKKPSNIPLFLYGLISYLLIIFILLHIIISQGLKFIYFPLSFYNAISDNLDIFKFIKSNLLITVIYIVIFSWLFNKMNLKKIFKMKSN